MKAIVLTRNGRVERVLLHEGNLPASIDQRLRRAGFTVSSVPPTRVRGDELEDVIMPLLQGDLFAAVSS